MHFFSVYMFYILCYAEVARVGGTEVRADGDQSEWLQSDGLGQGPDTRGVCGESEQSICYVQCQLEELGG